MDADLEAGRITTPPSIVFQVTHFSLAQLACILRLACWQACAPCSCGTVRDRPWRSVTRQESLQACGLQWNLLVIVCSAASCLSMCKQSRGGCAPCVQLCILCCSWNCCHSQLQGWRRCTCGLQVQNPYTMTTVSYACSQRIFPVPAFSIQARRYGCKMGCQSALHLQQTPLLGPGGAASCAFSLWPWHICP